jgi:hypothetical protein
MPDSLATLEAKRSKILDEFLSLGDLRPGSITAVVRRCGKPTCHCARPNDPGHDPQFRLTRSAGGLGKVSVTVLPATLLHQEIAREVKLFLDRVFAQRNKDGRTKNSARI